VLEMLAELMANRAGQLTPFSSFAKQLRVAGDTVRRWTEVLESFYYCYLVRPYSANRSRMLRKEPKFYLWDWAAIRDPGARFENLVASALRKAVDHWNDFGSCNAELHFVRDRDKREVDFLVTRDSAPWFLVECKLSRDRGPTRALRYFQKLLSVPHTFQVVLDMPFVEADPFERGEVVTVPARTLLSMLP